ncbi:glycine betaine ABC transporter substrate-binding protein [Gluconobacter kondonii]|uniref:glycine betaine ABC transporter substrate-binding protein n=1 Tax=Gluconobacter kondonii TaxID=941463 RepID=UPI00197D35E4|nr:glycine betaine ABC transporter substrate-binding protein [Gluconobacter kondonii]MBN3867644.1 hypothetical protein [Gluconobacter kondonii]MBS1054108.1 glycine betaine ABC transporter substrate-binding protein [Gluconobacter kondonii]MBS1055220.1 glycine betaine ABC transporter substrate-binding protein [Gluconobacter kondonii]
MTQMTIGHLYTSLHAGCASAVARVLEAYEVEVEYVDLDPDDVEDALEQGEVDLLVSAWFPRDEHLAGPGLRVLGDLYQPVVSFAALTPLGAVGTLTATDVDRIIVADDSRQALEEALKQLPALSVLSIESIGEGALIERLEKARDAGEKPLVVATQPHAVFHTDLLTVLEDPSRLLGGEMSARMILREDVARQTDSDLLDELSEMMLGNKVMSALDYVISVDGQDPEGAAEAWQRGRLIGR